MQTNTPGAAHDIAGTGIYQERTYPQFDCMGIYLWIWERMIEAEGRTEVIARKVHRDRPPSGSKGDASDTVLDICDDKCQI